MSKEVFVNSKTALVLQGGGTRGAFTAGVLDVLLEQAVYFPYVIGTSAGALNGANYIAKDLGRSKVVVTETMRDPRFASVRNFLFRRNVFNFRYLFYTVPKKLPFNETEFNESKAVFVAATTSVLDGAPHYFVKENFAQFAKPLAASASLPLISKPVMIDGKPYVDGGVCAAIPFRKALEDGYEKIIVVETRCRGYRKDDDGKARLARTMYRKYDKFKAAYAIKNKTYNEDCDELDRLEKDGVAFRICPDVPPSVGLVEKNREKLLALYEQGREVMEREIKNLYAFLGEEHESE